MTPPVVVQLQPVTLLPDEFFGQAQDDEPVQNTPVPAGVLTQQPL